MAFDCPKCGSRTKFKTLIADFDPLEFQKLFGYLPQKETAPGDDPGSNQPSEKSRSGLVFQKVSRTFGRLKDKSLRKRSQVKCPADPGPIPTGTTLSAESESRLPDPSTTESRELSDQKRSEAVWSCRSILDASVSLGNPSSAVNETTDEDVPPQYKSLQESSAKEHSNSEDESSAEKESFPENKDSANRDPDSESRSSAALEQVYGIQDIQTSPAPKTKAKADSETTADVGSPSLSGSVAPVVPPPTAKQERSRSPNPFAMTSCRAPEGSLFPVAFGKSETFPFSFGKSRPFIPSSFPLQNESKGKEVQGKEVKGNAVEGTEVEAFPKLPPAAPLTFKEVLVKPPPLSPTQTAQTSARTDPGVNMDYPETCTVKVAPGRRSSRPEFAHAVKGLMKP
ncbi:hypothetical protein LTS15_006670 [Exophiala xenobiotica]|nr:hypothetical protein LTS15_006670 [Exophiala xenobiotica]